MNLPRPFGIKPPKKTCSNPLPDLPWEDLLLPSQMLLPRIQSRKIRRIRTLKLRQWTKRMSATCLAPSSAARILKRRRCLNTTSPFQGLTVRRMNFSRSGRQTRAVSGLALTRSPGAKNTPLRTMNSLALPPSSLSQFVSFLL